MQLIDADVFREDLKRELENLCLNGLLGTPQNYEEIDRFIRRLDEQPTIEDEPVRHGYWKHPIKKARQYFCSECSGKESGRRPYCPRCGAKMDGGGDNA